MQISNSVGANEPVIDPLLDIPISTKDLNGNTKKIFPDIGSSKSNNNNSTNTKNYLDFVLHDDVLSEVPITTDILETWSEPSVYRKAEELVEQGKIFMPILVLANHRRLITVHESSCTVILYNAKTIVAGIQQKHYSSLSSYSISVAKYIYIDRLYILPLLSLAYIISFSHLYSSGYLLKYRF